MELKYVYVLRVIDGDTLLIVPVWNWNQVLCDEWYVRSFTFNRTSVELKLLSSSMVDFPKKSFNRTSVELKSNAADNAFANLEAF